ncbi:IclR family transcriptional regulator [Glaciimonas sp. Gout2]|uniref:IclR family transcriptional regulator n=1 Tax=unclassified Glaciimonas TaxID=2644401 RepID=UPI002B230F29|nr:MULTISPECIES: IclR family transcriptional regulator [unclassified Glaciimonas]MEB0010956.1 IclR family transcriptional regulator [Glaciimonas sp. Cout2]MEB0081739.1 IclR family transcriptional regulator [Glaciimonas sp. Gout2]
MSETFLPGPDNQPSTSSPKAAATRERPLMVLSVIAWHGKPITVKELKEATKLPQRALYRLLLPLKKWELIQEQDNLYAPGPLSVQLAWGFNLTSYLVINARTEMEKLMKLCDESVGLMVAVNNQVVCLDMVESLQSLRSSFSKGRSQPLLRGASAKALLAHLPLSIVDEVIAVQLSSQPKEESRLRDELSTIRAQGYAVSEGEGDMGVWGISTPIFSKSDHMVGTITLMSPAIRAADQQQKLIGVDGQDRDRDQRALKVVLTGISIGEKNASSSLLYRTFIRS